MITRRIALGAALVLAIAASATFSVDAADLAPSAKVPPIPSYVQKAVDASSRSDKDKARDGGRKPAAVFAYSGIKPGDHVIEIAAFGQYDTNILVNLVGDKGRIYMYDLPYQQTRQEVPTKAFTDAHPNTTHVFGKFDELSFPKDVDAVTIDMYYHDLDINKVNQAVFNKQMFDALKPGGKVLIVDHNAPAGTPRAVANKVHRIDPALIVSEMEAAGFKLVVNSSIFANPADDKNSVSYSPSEKGSTDRSLFVFQKPKK